MTVDFSTIDSALLRQIYELEPGDELEIIVQFTDEVTDRDLEEMKRVGIDPILNYHVIPAVYAKGPVRGILALSGYERTYWIEHNAT